MILTDLWRERITKAHILRLSYEFPTDEMENLLFGLTGDITLFPIVRQDGQNP